MNAIFTLPVWVYAAFGATWLVHILYLGTLTRRYKRLRDEIEESRK